MKLSHRERTRQAVPDGELLDDTPMELPANMHRTKRGIAAEIQEQIAIAVAQTHGAVMGELTPDQVLAELQDLDDDVDLDIHFKDRDYTQMASVPLEDPEPDPSLSSQAEPDPPPEEPASAASEK